MFVRRTLIAGLAFAAGVMTTSAATETTTEVVPPRTTAIAWADCVYGLESLPTPPLAAYSITIDGVVTRSFDDGRVESAVIGPKRYRAIADGIDRAFFGPPPEPTPTPTVIPGSGGLVPIGRSTMTDTRRGRFAVRHDGTWADWSVYGFTGPEYVAVRGAYATAHDPSLAWHPATPRIDAFAVCNRNAPLDAMLAPASPTPRSEASPR